MEYSTFRCLGSLLMGRRPIPHATTKIPRTRRSILTVVSTVACVKRAQATLPMAAPTRVPTKYLTISHSACPANHSLDLFHSFFSAPMFHLRRVGHRSSWIFDARNGG